MAKLLDLGPLRQKGWLAAQPAELQDWAAGAGRWRVYEKGQVLYQAGDAPDAVYGLGDGALEVTFPLVAAEPVTIHRAEPGLWIGESALLAQGVRTISLTAAARSRVFRIPAAAVWALLAKRQEFWRSFYALSHLNSETAVTLLAEALALSPTERLARRLLRLAGADGEVAASQGELARMIGMTRATLHRSIAELVVSGAIATGYRRLRVCDRAALERIVAEA